MEEMISEAFVTKARRPDLDLMEPVLLRDFLTPLSDGENLSGESRLEMFSREHEP